MGCGASVPADGAPSLAPAPAAAAPAPAPVSGAGQGAPASDSEATKVMLAAKYPVQGSAEAKSLDPDFDLILNPSLAVNEYPKAELEAARAAEHTSHGEHTSAGTGWRRP